MQLSTTVKVAIIDGVMNKNDLPSGQPDCREFAHIMKKDDIILVIAHHFPFALAKVAGLNNYISRPQPHSAPVVD